MANVQVVRSPFQISAGNTYRFCIIGTGREYLSP